MSARPARTTAGGSAKGCSSSTRTTRTTCRRRRQTRVLGYTYPAVQYRHDLGKAVTGGYVYRGKAIPALYGKYVFGDIASGRIFFVEESTLVNGRPSPFGEIKLRYLGRERSLLEILGEDRADLRFGMDERGAIYLLTKRDGVIRKLSIPAVE